MSSARILYAADQYTLVQSCLDTLGQWQEGWPQRRSYLLVPENRKLQMERAFLERFPNKALLLTDVLSFTRLARMVAEAIGERSDRFLKTAEKQLLIRSILYQNPNLFPQFAGLARRSGYLEGLVKLLGDFRRAELRPEALQDCSEELEQKGMDPQKLGELAKLYAYYEDALNKQGYFDQEMRLNQLADRLEELVDECKRESDPKRWKHPLHRLGFLRESWIYVNGFGEERLFTPQEERILVALSQLTERFVCSVLVTQAEPRAEVRRLQTARIKDLGYETICSLQKRRPDFQVEHLPLSEDGRDRAGDLSRIQLVTASDAQQEAHLCVGELFRYKQAHPELKWRDFAILTCRPESTDLLSAPLETLGIPAYLDRRIPLSGNPLIRYVLTLLQIPGSGWSRSVVLSHLRTGLAGLGEDEIDVLENFWLARGMDHHLLLDARRYANNWQILEDPAFLDDAEIGEEIKEEKGYLDEGHQPSQEGEGAGEICLPIQALARTYRERSLDSLRDFYAQLPARPRTNQLIPALLEFFERQGIPDRLQHALERASEKSPDLALGYARAWDQLLTYLERLLDLIPEDLLELDQLAELLATTLNRSYAESIPSLVDQVLVGGVEAVLTQQYAVVYVLGADAHHFPLSPLDEGLLRDRERMAINAALESRAEGATLPVSSHTERDRKTVFESKLLRAYRERLYLSTTTDAGFAPLGQRIRKYQEQERSRQFAQPQDVAAPAIPKEIILPALPVHPLEVRRVFPEYQLPAPQPVKGVSGLSSAGARSVKLAPSLLRELLEGQYRFSISQLERYRRCPYSYFAHYLLRVQPRRIWQVERMNLGTLIHGVLEDEIRRSQEQLLSLPPQAWPQWLKAEWAVDPEAVGGLERRVHRALQKTIQRSPRGELAVFNEPGTCHANLRQARQILMHNLPLLHQEFCQSPAFLPVAQEMRFQLNRSIALQETGESMDYQLQGVIDRVDQGPYPETKAFRIIDYKTGGKAIDPLGLWAGLDLQLPLYLQAYHQIHGEVLPWGAGYRSIRMPGDPRGEASFGQDLHSLWSTQKQSGGDPVLAQAYDLGDDHGSRVGGGKPLLEAEGLLQLMQHSQTCADESVKRLLGGELSPAPCCTADSQSIPCQYCDYRSLCGIERPMAIVTQHDFPPSAKQARYKIDRLRLALQEEQVEKGAQDESL